MNVDELDKLLQEMTGKKDTKTQLRAVAHWLKKIKDSKDDKYTSYEERELPSIMRLNELKLIHIEEGNKEEKIGTVHAKLTESGQDLYDEFFRTGYFMKA